MKLIVNTILFETPIQKEIGSTISKQKKKFFSVFHMKHIFLNRSIDQRIYQHVN